MPLALAQRQTLDLSGACPELCELNDGMGALGVACIHIACVQQHHELGLAVKYGAIESIVRERDVEAIRAGPFRGRRVLDQFGSPLLLAHGQLAVRARGQSIYCVAGAGGIITAAVALKRFVRGQKEQPRDLKRQLEPPPLRHYFEFAIVSNRPNRLLHNFRARIAAGVGMVLGGMVVVAVVVVVVVGVVMSAGLLLEEDACSDRIDFALHHGRLFAVLFPLPVADPEIQPLWSDDDLRVWGVRFGV